ncbi:MAG TPA: LacI family DNA-binding transcriptional regulator [Opitutaceae bacterium]
MPSIKDVAREAGVAISTVSRVMGASGYVSAEARERVLAAVKKLGYQPNRVARSLRSQSSQVIGLIVADIQNPFFGQVSRAVENMAYAHDYSLFICNADEDAEKELRYFQAMAAEKVAGIILAPSRSRSEAIGEQVAAGLPVVAVDRRVAGVDVDTVLIDNVDAGDRITQCLVDGGYRKIAGLFGADSFTGRARQEGFRRALVRNGLEAHTVRLTPAFEEEGMVAARKIIEMESPPDALVCSSALLATGAFRVIRQAGVVVPEQMGFACIDDPPWGELVVPMVTALRQPARLIGEIAAEMLFKRIQDPSRPVGEVCLKGELVVRGSSTRAKQAAAGC